MQLTGEAEEVLEAAVDECKKPLLDDLEFFRSILIYEHVVEDPQGTACAGRLLSKQVGTSTTSEPCNNRK